MIHRLIIVFLLLTPFGLFGQTAFFDSLSAEHTKEIYAVLKTVIKSERLNKKFGLQLQPAPNCNINNDDTSYLLTFLIKPQPIDTVRKSKSSDFVLVSNMTYPDRNILTQADIDYILAAKKLSQLFAWDNKKLGFNIKNESRFYVFSVPCFNQAHDKAIVMYEFLCPGLCGSGQTLLVSKTEKGWSVSNLELWFH